MAAVNTLKKIADNTFGLLNKGVHYLLQQLDPGNKNLYMLILYPKGVDDLSIGGSILDIALDTLIATVYTRSFDIPFMSIDYEAFGEIKGSKKVIYPDSVNISLLEDEFGTVRNYLYKWLNNIIFPVDEIDPISGIARVNYVFTDNQEGAKKNAILLSQSGIGLPSLRPIKMYGLKFQSLDNVTYGHGESEPLIYSVTCAVDSVWFAPLF